MLKYYSFIVYLILFIFLQNNFNDVSSFSTGAGTCVVEEMSTTGHGAQLKKSGDGGYKLTTSGKAGNFDISVTNQNGAQLEGILIYAVNTGTTTKTGKFAQPDATTFQTCSGDPDLVTLTHTSKVVKKLPLQFKWSGDKAGNVTFRALAVEKAKAWYMLDDLTVSLDDGKTATPPTNTNNADPNSASPAAAANDQGFIAWVKKYSLFVIMIALTTILYVVGSIVELMLKKQNIKARSFAKTVGGFGIAK